LCVLSMLVGMAPRPALGRVMPGRLKQGKPNLLEAAAGGLAAAGDASGADGAKAAAAFCFKKDEKPAMSRAVSETGLASSWVVPAGMGRPQG
jgi:hypothetical protein